MWVSAVDDGWSGPLADRAKAHAARIGAGLAHQLMDTTWHPAVDLPAGDRQL